MTGGELQLGGTSGGRFTVGATSNTASTSSSAPAGIFNMAGKTTCTLTVNVNSKPATAAGKSFIVYVDNNTTSTANSPLASASKVLAVDSVTGIGIGANTFTWNAVGTSTSFIQIRAESTVQINIDSMSMSCS